MNELIKERNNLAKQCFVAHFDEIKDTSIIAREAVSSADCMMEEMYGEDWKTVCNKPTIPSGDAEIGTYSHNGETWVRVTALGEDFIIAPHDLDGGKDDFNYDQAMARLKELHLDTFNRKQLFILGIYIEEINAKLEETGGDKFAPDLYISNELWHPVGSCADFTAAYSWFFNGTTGCVNTYYRSYGLFRSRPALALSSLINL